MQLAACLFQAILIEFELKWSKLCTLSTLMKLMNFICVQVNAIVLIICLLLLPSTVVRQESRIPQCLRGKQFFRSGNQCLITTFLPPTCTTV